MRLWMAIDNSNRLRLPEYVADTPQELAEKFHVKLNNIYSSATHAKRNPEKSWRFIMVEVEDEEDYTGS